MQILKEWHLVKSEKKKDKTKFIVTGSSLVLACSNWVWFDLYTTHRLLWLQIRDLCSPYMAITKTSPP